MSSRSGLGWPVMRTDCASAGGDQVGAHLRRPHNFLALARQARTQREDVVGNVWRCTAPCRRQGCRPVPTRARDPRPAPEVGDPAMSIGKAALGGLHEMAFERPHGRGTPGSHAGLIEDVLDVVARRLDGDAEVLSDLPVGLSGGEREHDLMLALREARGQLALPFRHAARR